ncbi:MAG: hypothetical protein HZB38_10375 [Planctomycetes bacterium]|nr:hypothetical protein [Planctomycetota bacterium]
MPQLPPEMTPFARSPGFARWTTPILLSACALLSGGLLLFGGCPSEPPDDDSPGFSNITDSTNDGASYVGSSACNNCHADIAALHAGHGHASQLVAIKGVAPTYPQPGAEVPNPPAGYAWTDISYVIGGYAKGALFIDRDGYILNTGVTGVPTQWNLDFPKNGTSAGFAAFEPAASERTPYDYARFSHQTTGAHPQDPDEPLFQENRPGFLGTWAEAGVQCEACHGPGGKHFRTVGDSVRIDRSRIFVDPDGTKSCKVCHSEPFSDQSGKIAAKDGYIVSTAQYPELRASGGHRDFACTICHDPHRSSITDRANAVRNACTGCHTTQNMAGHRGAVLTRDDGYTETLACESCHMPLAAKRASTANTAVLGTDVHIGDTRSHIFRINAAADNFSQVLSADGSEVLRDADGRAALSVDFVCLRCHNGNGIFALTPARAAEIAARVHQFPE